MSEIIVLDTHIWIWFINLEWKRFPSSWVDVIETADLVGISPVSCYEVAISLDALKLPILFLLHKEFENFKVQCKCV